MEEPKRTTQKLEREILVDKSTWLINYKQGDNWNDLLKEVVTFDSVEEFWGVYVILPTLFPIPQANPHHPSRTT